MNELDDDSDSGSEGILGIGNLDLAGVDFDQVEDPNALSEEDKTALRLEMECLAGKLSEISVQQRQKTTTGRIHDLLEIATKISSGMYVDVLSSETAEWLLSEVPAFNKSLSIQEHIRSMLVSRLESISDCVAAEFIGVAAFNMFLQINYTGPTLDLQQIHAEINPHRSFREKLRASAREENTQEHKQITVRRDMAYQNAVLSELAVDGQWPCQVVEGPYFLLLARSIFLTLSDLESSGWGAPTQVPPIVPTRNLLRLTGRMTSHLLWSSRAAIAHERLFLGDEPTTTIWNEIEAVFPKCVRILSTKGKDLHATVLLEFGLACHHFGRRKRGKKLFLQAKDTTGLLLEVTGAQGKRTKFQQKATAQMVVRAASALDPNHTSSAEAADDKVKSQMIGFNEDDILHERVQFEESEENVIKPLTILDQAIVLGLCLDIKDNNPADRLTAEEMSAFLARVLCHHDDWMVYSTALLERAWLEFEGNHTKERAILQMQALADQHTNRLTITQSTRQSVEDSSPVEERLRNLHSIVYPPRWQMLRDVADRYAQIGIVTSAAEIFAEIESWDEVVDCYRRAGRVKRAEEIVRERLTIHETPRMWAALGDITNEPAHHIRAIELSHGRFSQAYISLGKYYFDMGQLDLAVENYRGALKLRPLLPSVWFRVGTISMQLGDWEAALTSFTEVVQQHPEEAEAWANVAAVHMHRKHPNEAYPALVESLRHNRTNWRVWVSKLYTCLDLNKYDEAAQACHMLLDLSASKSSQGVPELEEKCVRAIVGGTVGNYKLAKESADSAALESARRSLSRVHELLNRMLRKQNEAWVFETAAYLYEHIGLDKEVHENLMKEYRSLTSVRAWEKDEAQVRRVCRTVLQIFSYQQSNKEELAKCKFLLSGVVKRISQAWNDGRRLPDEVGALEDALAETVAKLAAA